VADNLTRRVVEIIVDAKNQTTEGLAAATAELSAFQSSVTAIGKNLALIGGGMMLAGGGLTAAIGGLVDQAASFDAALVDVQNNTNMSDADVQTMRDTILSLGQDTGASFASLEQGFMHVMNITGDAAAAQDILAVATESAVSTGGDAAATANVLANAMHEYGLDTSNAATAQQRNAEITANATRVMGVFHLAAAEGNMTLEQFSENSGKMFGVAANLHIPLEQAAAAYTALTKHGYDASQAQTQMVDLMTHMINPTKAAESEIRKLSQASGVDLVSDFSAAGLSSKGLDGVLADLRTAYHRLGYSQDDVTGSAMRVINAQRGGLGLASLLGTAWDDNRKILTDLTNEQLVNNVTTDSMNRTHATLSNEMARLKNGLEATAITLGDALTPSVRKGADELMTLLGRVQSYVSQNPQLVAQTLTTVATFLLLGGAFLLVTGILLPVAGFLLTTTLGLVRLGISAVGATISIAGFIGNLILMGAQLLIAAARFTVMTAAALVNTIAVLGVREGLAYLAISAAEALSGMVAGFLAWAGAAVAAAAATIMALLPVLAPIALGVAAVIALYEAWTHNFLGIRDIVGTVVSFIVDKLGAVFGAIGDLLVKVGILPANWRDSWESMKSETASAASTIAGTATSAFDQVKSGGVGALAGLSLQGMGSFNTLATGGLSSLAGLQSGGVSSLDALQAQGGAALAELQAQSNQSYQGMQENSAALLALQQADTVKTLGAIKDTHVTTSQDIARSDQQITTRMANTHQQEMEQLAFDHQTTVSNLAEQHKETLTKMSADHSAQIKQLSFDHQQKMAQLAAQHDQIMQQLRAKHESTAQEISRYQQARDLEMQTYHNEQMSLIDTTTQTKLADMQSYHQQTMDAMTTYHDQKMQAFADTTRTHMDAAHSSIQTSMDQSQQVVTTDATNITNAINAIPTQHDIYIVTHHIDVYGHASGGPVAAGQVYMVGERGPELFVSDEAGQIIPNDQLGRTTYDSYVGGAGGGISSPGAPGGGTVINNYFSVTGNKILKSSDVSDLAELLAQYFNRKLSLSLQH